MSQGDVSTRSDLRGGMGWVVFGLAILAGAWRMDRFESMGATVYTAPGFVPAMFGFALVLLGSVLAWRGSRAEPASAADAPTEPLLSRRVGLMLALTFAYAAVLVGRLPFWLATTLFVAAFTATFTEDQPPLRRAWVAIASGLLTSLVVVLVFERVFLVRLP
jgi:hypothetical protein